MVMEQRVDPYPFTPQFEAGTIALCCESAKFWSVVGYALDPEAFSGQGKYSPPKLLLRACRAIAAELGRGPGSTVAVLQRVKTMHADGAITHDQLVAAIDYATGVDDVPDEEVTSNEIGRILRDRMHRDAMHQMMEVHTGNARPEDVMRTLELAQTIGKVDTDLGVKMGRGSFDAINDLRSMDRMPTGALELDAHTGGGLPRGQLGFYVAKPGGGKSIALSSQAAFGVRRRALTGVITLELPPGVILARVKASLTGIPTNQLMQGEHHRCEQILEQMMPTLGALHVKHFTAYTTTNAHVEDWVKEVEDLEGARMDLLVVDYADKIGAPTTGSSKNSAEYHAMRHVYERLRIHAYERNAWTWTASQPTRAHKGQQLLDLDHVADSMHKVRIADLVVTINPRDEGASNLFYVAKNRTGASQIKVGPLPHEFHLGRIVPMDETATGLAATDPDSPELEQAWDVAQVAQAMRDDDGGGNPFD